jgi:AcrR family transcriptional regulator
MRALQDNGASISEERRELIIAAARRCFLKYSLQKTSIDDIAREAGMARSGVYRYFTNRDDIVEAAMLRRMEEFIASSAKLMQEAKDLGDALLKLSIATVETGRNDPELRQVFGEDGHIGIIDLLGGSRPAAQQIVMNFWKPALDRGRAAGDMRPDISDDEAIEWMRGVYVMLILRKELDATQERNLIEKFLIYSLLSPKALHARQREG